MELSLFDLQKIFRYLSFCYGIKNVDEAVGFADGTLERLIGKLIVEQEKISLDIKLLK